MKINGREIGPGHPPYIVAEIGASHGGKIERAIALMSAAMGAGADAVKLQCYTPDTITIDCDKPDFIIKDGPWRGRKLYELYAEAHTPWGWFPELFDVAKRHGQTIFASVFDKTSVDYLEGLGCPAYKIASMEIVDIPLIEYAASTGKPLILSTGMAVYGEMDEAHFVAEEAGADAVLLTCISGYPSDIEEVYFPSAGDGFFGISDHTPGFIVPAIATARHAYIIEKHIKWYDDTTSEDAGFALDPDEFREMCQTVRSVYKAMQTRFPVGNKASERSSRQLRRSLYVVEDVREGELFTERNVRSIRPAYGLPPKAISTVLGRKARSNIERGTALSWDLIASS